MTRFYQPGTGRWFESMEDASQALTAELHQEKAAQRAFADALPWQTESRKERDRLWLWTEMRQAELVSDRGALSEPLSPALGLQMGARELTTRVAKLDRINAALEEHRRLMMMLGPRRG